MTTLFRRDRRRALTGSAVAGVLAVALVMGVLQFSSPARAADGSSCADPVTGPPAGPATVSTKSTDAFGTVLEIGSGDHTGCSLYLLTSDQLHALTGSHFACSDDVNALAAPCDTVLWPALLTDGPPIAGPGVNRRLLGTVTRADLPGLPAVQQVTYAGQPLYRFLLDETVGETAGANLFDPVTSPTGTWYLVDPTRGGPAPGTAQLRLETAPVRGGGPASVLAVTMDHGFDFLPDGSFPVYTLAGGHGPRRSAPRMGPVDQRGLCDALCSQYWQPVLTSGRPEAGAGVDQHALGTIRRPDGSRQVTYMRQPLYLFADDAYFPLPDGTTPFGTARIDGAGAKTIWGVFDTIPPSS